MYINEVIREADALNPNEYTLNEKYAWIDELNATLMQEHLYKYASVELEPMEDGTYLLPEGITFEMVDRIIAQGRSIEKYDFRSFGITPLYTPRERFFVPVHCQARGAITVIYLAQYEPIRNIEAAIAKFGTNLAVVSGHSFMTGDSVKLTVKSGSTVVHTYDELSVIEAVNDIQNDYETEIELSTLDDGTGRYYAQFPIGKLILLINDTESNLTVFQDADDYYTQISQPISAGESRTIVKLKSSVGGADPENGYVYVLQNSESVLRLNDNSIDSSYISRSGEVKRIITEQTLVPAPYDRMYIDWILAKIAFYQRNYIVYNQQMNKFYNTLRQFDNWRISRAPADKDNKIRNWMK